MQMGNKKQQKAYAVIRELNICDDLSSCNPVLCGTLPIGIDILGSDLDIVMEVQDLDYFEERLQILYHSKGNFKLKRTTIRGNPVVKANFFFRNFEFELFGQSQPVLKQNAYLHMLIEHKLLEKRPNLKEKVINLKKQGYKTEPAFCTLLGIPGDPYEGLIQYGIKEGIITEVV
ncbi:DUF4269 domain-containing protein [Virgibacillus sp. NKC19-3]|uniref:DUF4269 domain-containing protein n=1 Tax=Virgibacillus saliphilus TaxID=2831674 RepID=UPI001C9A7716|nr:DUF4269 domain-containing protein [Virgibacillus sp. NKC19-3]MBY7142160.1 DUF4269 domain-containing protein [Virgibacillus sp. NKC19-3]